MPFKTMTRRAPACAALCALAISVFVASTSSAQERLRVGYGRLVVNDSAGELKDRWRSGSIASSRVWGYGWDGQAPARPGELLELRLHGQVIAPSSLKDFNPDDRLYAGALSAGLHTHFQRGLAEVSLGGDLVVTGPQTRLDELQTALHDLLNIPRPSDDILDEQIENGFHPTLVAEVGSTFELGSAGRVRPFTELRWGAETLARVGFDMSFGAFGKDELMVRESVSGQQYQAISKDPVGTSFFLGADVAQVNSSVYMPEDRGPELEQNRHRLRAGVNWQGKSWGAQYGLTYLSEEFEGQPEGQFLGGVRIKYNF